MALRRALLLAAVLGLTLGACGDDDDTQGRKEPAGTAARTTLATASPPGNDALLRVLALDPVNRSGVRGTARLLLQGRRLTVEAVVNGSMRGKVHLQHLHLPRGKGDGGCPSKDLDRNRDGLVSLEEGARAYGDPAVLLDPFPKPDSDQFRYVQTLRLPRGFPLDRAALVVHGMNVKRKYDVLIPIACGRIGDGWVREVTLEPVNWSSVAGTARLWDAGGRLGVWHSVAGPIDDGHGHLQHIHLPDGDGAASCPTEELDRDRDGLVSLEEATPVVGAPAIALEPFPKPDKLLFEYMETVDAEAGPDLDRGVVVFHGMEVDGKFDETIPVACGRIDPTLSSASLAEPVATGSGSGSGAAAYGVDP